MEKEMRDLPSTALTNVFRAVGDSSYSLYLVHPFALAITAMLIKKIHLQRYEFLSIVILVLSALIAGYLCYIFLERNLNKIFKSNVHKAMSADQPDVLTQQ
jgi:exopolysaccharide production protein ExoZ